MKIKDLFTKIANDEEVPKKIKYNDTIYIYREYTKQYYVEGCMGMFENSLRYELTSFNKLNDEVEIIEEIKLPKKIKSNGKEFYSDNIDIWIDKEETSAYCEYLMNKYNDLIDYLESKEKGE